MGFVTRRPFVEQLTSEDLLVIMSQCLSKKKICCSRNKNMYIISNFSVHFFDFRLCILRYLSKVGSKKGHDSTSMGTTIAFRNQLLCRYEAVSPIPVTQAPTGRHATGVSIPVSNWYKTGINQH